MRLIDGDALMETLQILYKNNRAITPSTAISNVQEGVCSAYLSAIEVVQDAPTIDSMPVWVSVKDRLPTEKINAKTLDFEEVMCAMVFGDVRCYKYGLQHFWNGRTIIDEYVTHWMYLPEPPKEVSE